MNKWMNYIGALRMKIKILEPQMEHFHEMDLVNPFLGHAKYLTFLNMCLQG